MTILSDFDDDRPLDLKPADRASTETVAPRRVRSQLVALDSALLELQDDAEYLFAHVSSKDGRTTLRGLYSGLEDAHERVQRALKSVERGG